MALPPGVPNLLDPAITFLNVANVLAGDTFIGYGPGEPPLWGIYEGATPVVIADTVTDFGYQQDWTVADYPVERGGFESYDKVNSPFRIRIQFVAGGSEANRQALLDSIAAIGDPLTLYTAVTPTAVYPSLNVEHYDYRRTSRNGLGLLIVDVHFLEIREDGVNNFQNVASPSAFQPALVGNIQSPEVTPNGTGGSGTITIKPGTGGSASG
jgi:hypothetical protein